MEDKTSVDDIVRYIQTNENVKKIWLWSKKEMDARHDLSHSSWHILQVAKNIYMYRTEFLLDDQELECAIICGLLHDVCDRKILVKSKEDHIRDLRELLYSLYGDLKTETQIETLVEIILNISITKWLNGQIKEELIQNPIFLIVQLSDSMEQLGMNGIFRIGLHVGEKFVEENESAYIYKKGVNDYKSCMFFLGEEGKFMKIGNFLLDKYGFSPMIVYDISFRLKLLRLFYVENLKNYIEIETLFEDK